MLPRDGDPLPEEDGGQRLGVDFVGVVDPQCLVQELHTSLGATTTGVGGQPRADDDQLLTRPPLTVSAPRALNERSGGRVIPGIATDDSVVYTLALCPEDFTGCERSD
jgi:hypothetical protein